MFYSFKFFIVSKCIPTIKNISHKVLISNRYIITVLLYNLSVRLGSKNIILHIDFCALMCYHSNITEKEVFVMIGIITAKLNYWFTFTFAEFFAGFYCYAKDH